MDIKKIFKPKAYILFLQRKWIDFNIKIRRSCITKTSVLGQTVFFYISSQKEYSMRAKGSYTAEKSTMHWIENYITPDEIVYDIGANVGAYSLLIGKLIQQASGKGRVYSFEPESSNFFSLNKNIVLNDLDRWIIPIPLAFGDRLKLGNFYLSSEIPGSATHALDSPISEGNAFNPVRRQGILAISLDEFVNLENSEFPNHIKIDVDGLEKQIINNMAKTLEDKRLKSICIEIAENVSHGKIESIITKNGFNVEYLEEWNNEYGKFSNIVYVRSN